MEKTNLGNRFVRTKSLSILVVICSGLLYLADLATGYFSFNASLLDMLLATAFILLVVVPFGILIDLYEKHKQGK